MLPVAAVYDRRSLSSTAKIDAVAVAGVTIPAADPCSVAVALGPTPLAAKPRQKNGR